MNYTEALLYFEKLQSSNLIKDADEKYGKFLLSEVSKQHEFKNYIGLGLDGILILAWDKKNIRQSVFKFARPKTSKATAAEKLKRRVKSVFAARNEPESTLKETSEMERSLRGWQLQQQLKSVIRNNKELKTIGDIPTIYQIGNIPKLYVEMEYIPGTDLVTWCKHQTDDYKVMEMIRDVCIFLQKGLHENNIVHGDLKPENFIITGSSDYQIYLIDFNSSKDISDNFSITADNEQRYTMPYASRNQVQNFKERTFSDDVYSMGVVMYYCLIRKTALEHYQDVPDAQNFKAMHPLRYIKEPVLQQIFNRAVRLGAPYLSFASFIEDIENKYLKKKKKIKPVFELDNRIRLIKIWENYIKGSNYYEKT